MREPRGDDAPEPGPADGAPADASAAVEGDGSPGASDARASGRTVRRKRAAGTGRAAGVVDDGGSTVPHVAAEPPRVARERYVRSVWGVVAGLGIVAGAVVVATGVADFDAGPFCARVRAVQAQGAAATTTTSAPPTTATTAPGESVIAAPEPLTLSQARAELEARRSYLGLVPHEHEDELDLLIERSAALVAALEPLGADATVEQRAGAAAQVDREAGDDYLDASFVLDDYARRTCGL